MHNSGHIRKEERPVLSLSHFERDFPASRSFHTYHKFARCQLTEKPNLQLSRLKRVKKIFNPKAIGRDAGVPCYLNNFVEDILQPKSFKISQTSNSVL